MTTARGVGNLKAWAALVAAVVSAAIAAAVIGMTLDAGPAQAATASDATIKATTFEVGGPGDFRQTAAAFARCPSRTRAVGGGVVRSSPANHQDMRVMASGPLDATGNTLETNDGDKAKFWYAAVVNFAPSTEPAATFRVFAICSRSSNATIEATTLSVGSNQIGEEFAKCPGRKRALGGGVVQSGPAAEAGYVGASGPLDNTGVTANTVTGDVAKQWYATVGTWEPVTYKVFAICSRDSAAKIKATPFTVASNPSGANAEASARCGRTKRALGGGVVQSGPMDGLMMRESGPLDGTGAALQTKTGDVAKQWYAAVGNFGTLGSPPRELKVFAICE